MRTNRDDKMKLLDSQPIYCAKIELDGKYYHAGKIDYFNLTVEHD